VKQKKQSANVNQPLVINEIAKPQFKGDKKRLIQVVEGMTGPLVNQNGKSIIPPCFSDPNLESGVCNPLLPLRVDRGEPCECIFVKSCLVAKLLSVNIPINAVKAAHKPYEQVLAEADELFEQRQEQEKVDPNVEIRDRQHLRAHVASIVLQPPLNPFRKNSLRRLVLDLMTKDWITLGDLKAAVLALRPDAARLDQVIQQVTALTAQEAGNYRILEQFGKYKSFRKV